MALTCIQVVGLVLHSHASLLFPHSWVSGPLLGTVHCRSGCIYHCIRTWASRYHIRWWSEDNQAGSECNTGRKWMQHWQEVNATPAGSECNTGRKWMQHRKLNSFMHAWRGHVMQKPWQMPVTSSLRWRATQGWSRLGNIWWLDGRKVCVVTVCVRVLVLSVWMCVHVCVLACGIAQGMVVFSC